MSEKKIQNFKTYWLDFKQKYGLTEKQLEQFYSYYKLLVFYNKQFNLTAIVDEQKIIADHFEDSLALVKYYDLKKIKSICDIGAGAGFPGLPLKIFFSNLHLYLIEVNHKKINFLNEVARQLSLYSVETIDLDWRNFLRTTKYDIGLFVSRASLQPEELLRFIKPSSFYKNATLVYWAAKDWIPSEKVRPYIEKDISYTIKNKQRRLIFFQMK